MASYSDYIRFAVNNALYINNPDERCIKIQKQIRQIIHDNKCMLEDNCDENCIYPKCILLSLEKEVNKINDEKYLYIFKNNFGNVKIGVSKNIQQRKKALETQSGFEITDIYTSNTKYPSEQAYKLEAQLHKYFNVYKVKGEWFNVDFSIVKDYFIKNNI